MSSLPGDKRSFLESVPSLFRKFKLKLNGEHFLGSLAIGRGGDFDAPRRWFDAPQPSAEKRVRCRNLRVRDRPMPVKIRPAINRIKSH
jgi:hypothetical protein